MSTHHEPHGVVLHDSATDQLRTGERAWRVWDPRTERYRVLRLRVARGRLVEIEEHEDTDVVLDTEGGPVL